MEPDVPFLLISYLTSSVVRSLPVSAMPPRAFRKRERGLPTWGWDCFSSWPRRAGGPAVAGMDVAEAQGWQSPRDSRFLDGAGSAPLVLLSIPWSPPLWIPPLPAVCSTGELALSALSGRFWCDPSPRYFRDSRRGGFCCWRVASLPAPRPSSARSLVNITPSGTPACRGLVTGFISS